MIAVLFSDRSRAAYAVARLELDAAAVCLHHPLAQRESNPAVFALIRGIRLKHAKRPFVRGLRNPRPVVRDREQTIAALVGDADVERAVGAVVVLYRVADQIAQHGFERRLGRDEGLRFDLQANLE